MQGAAESTARKLAEQGHGVRAQTVDLAAPDAARARVEDAAASLGGIDVLTATRRASHSPHSSPLLTSPSRTLAAEGAPDGIRANTISPGFVASPATDAAVDDNGQQYMLNMHLIQRIGTGPDIAALALYLASDESSWVTGQNISVDGGWTAGYR